MKNHITPPRDVTPMARALAVIAEQILIAEGEVDGAVMETELVFKWEELLDDGTVRSCWATWTIELRDQIGRAA